MIEYDDKNPRHVLLMRCAKKEGKTFEEKYNEVTSRWEAEAPRRDAYRAYRDACVRVDCARRVYSYDSDEVKQAELNVHNAYQEYLVLKNGE